MKWYISSKDIQYLEIIYCKPGVCDANANCTEGNLQAVCTCKSGFYGDGKSCTDTDECSDAELNDCHQHANCNNLMGGYSCVCKPGYTGDGKKSCESEIFIFEIFGILYICENPIWGTDVNF